jgi:hypothetical protein
MHVSYLTLVRPIHPPPVLESIHKATISPDLDILEPPNAFCATITRKSLIGSNSIPPRSSYAPAVDALGEAMERLSSL